eukprot:TRINITY_DN10527_c0_g1_i2.p1 TRINITY_DN10527_c0_g1~~TRINITY_DN10527_c0_g1_i2.p1  ORF type:complete len:336 (-),score=61.34 TRINITY_DN10527_c0_g1_i2:720-1703(-)
MSKRCVDDVSMMIKIAKVQENGVHKNNKEKLPYSESNDKEQDSLLLEPYSHILSVPGKDIRGKLMAGFNQWLKIPEEKLTQIREIVQMLHNASLLIDDIEDSSLLRRGIPVAHHIYGQASTINCANYVMFIGLERCHSLGHPEASRVFTEQLLELHRGQGMEIYWRDNFTCPSEEEYKQMITRKTGGLFNLAIRLMQLFSESTHDFKKLIQLLGLYFQIRDDYINLTSEDYACNKSFAEDLTEGKFSFPILHTVRNGNTDDRVIKILRQRTQDLEVKKFCIKLIEEAGSFEYTKKVMEELDNSILEEIEKIGDNQILRGVMTQLRNF